jgi:hypothetical protein
MYRLIWRTNSMHGRRQNMQPPRKQNGKANGDVKPKCVLPARRGASRPVKPDDDLPPAPPIGRQAVLDTQAGDAAGGEVHRTPDTQVADDLAALCASLKEHQRRRKFAITAQSRADRAIEALIASVVFAYHNGETETERKKKFEEAAQIRRAVEKDKPAAGDSGLHRMIKISAAGRSVWDEERNRVEDEMRRLAALLPVADWATAIRGFGLLNLAIVVGEAGRPLHDYGSVSKLWKRLGLAVIDGRRQQRIGNDKDLAIQHGYSAVRRSQVYVVGSVSVFMAQRAGMKYREVYDKRRAHTLPRIAATADLPFKHRDKWTPKRADSDARRVMTKALLCDLWCHWRDCVRLGAIEHAMPTKAMPPAAETGQSWGDAPYRHARSAAPTASGAIAKLIPNNAMPPAAETGQASRDAHVTDARSAAPTRSGANFALIPSGEMPPAAETTGHSAVDAQSSSARSAAPIPSGAISHLIPNGVVPPAAETGHRSVDARAGGARPAAPTERGQQRHDTQAYAAPAAETGQASRDAHLTDAHPAAPKRSRSGAGNQMPPNAGVPPAAGGSGETPGLPP